MPQEKAAINTMVQPVARQLLIKLRVTRVGSKVSDEEQSQGEPRQERKGQVSVRDNPKNRFGDCRNSFLQKLPSFSLATGWKMQSRPKLKR
jgi:hypothetical protein